MLGKECSHHCTALDDKPGVCARVPQGRHAEERRSSPGIWLSLTSSSSPMRPLQSRQAARGWRLRRRTPLLPTPARRPARVWLIHVESRVVRTRGEEGEKSSKTQRRGGERRVAREDSAEEREPETDMRRSGRQIGEGPEERGLQLQGVSWRCRNDVSVRRTFGV